MHANIYQIEKHPVTEDERISESDFYEHLDDIPADYVSDMDENEEEESLDWLDHFLPKTMFRREGREITYLGPDENVLQEWKDKAQGILDRFTAKELAEGKADWTYRYDLKKVVSNMLDTDCRFYQSEDGYAIASTEFIIDNVLHMEKGTKLYVGAVIDYHY